MLMPERVWLPAVRTTLPVPAITPLKVSAAVVSVRVCVPKVTLPPPAKLMMLAPLVVALISKLALLITLAEVAMVPVPLKAKVPPLMVVVPV